MIRYPAILSLALGLVALTLGGCGNDRGRSGPTASVDAGDRKVRLLDGGVPTDSGVAADSGGVDSTPIADAGTVDTTTGTDAATSAGSPPGSPCACDADCQATGSNPGVCILGVCMQIATATCANGGSTGECSAGSRCWGLEGVEGSLCWPDCDTFSCAGACDGDGSCAPSMETSCDASCGSVCGS